MLQCFLLILLFLISGDSNVLPREKTFEKVLKLYTYNIVNQSIIAGHLCKKQKSFKSKCCSCDSSCIKYGNCCIDKLINFFPDEKEADNNKTIIEKEFNGIESGNLTNGIKSRENFEDPSRYQCSPIFESQLLKKIEGSSSKRYMMI